MAKKRLPTAILHNSWCAILMRALEDLGGDATVGEIHENLERSDDPVVRKRIRRRSWKNTVRLMLAENADGSGHDVFHRVERGRFELKGASPVRKKLKAELEATLRMFRMIPNLTLESVEVESHIEERKRSVDVRYVCKVKKG